MQQFFFNTTVLLWIYRNVVVSHVLLHVVSTSCSEMKQLCPVTYRHEPQSTWCYPTPMLPWQTHGLRNTSKDPQNKMQLWASRSAVCGGLTWILRRTCRTVPALLHRRLSSSLRATPTSQETPSSLSEAPEQRQPVASPSPNAGASNSVFRMHQPPEPRGSSRPGCPEPLDPENLPETCLAHSHNN